MSWLLAIKVFCAVAALGLALLKVISYLKGRKDAERKILLKSAEEVADASQRVAAEVRRTAHEVESFGPDTPVDRANKLLSGEGHDGT